MAKRASCIQCVIMQLVVEESGLQNGKIGRGKGKEKVKFTLGVVCICNRDGTHREVVGSLPIRTKNFWTQNFFRLTVTRPRSEPVGYSLLLVTWLGRRLFQIWEWILRNIPGKQLFPTIVYSRVPAIFKHGFCCSHSPLLLSLSPRFAVSVLSMQTTRTPLIEIFVSHSMDLTRKQQSTVRKYLRARRGDLCIDAS